MPRCAPAGTAAPPVPSASDDDRRRLVDAGLRVVCGTTGWSVSPELAELAASRGGGLIVAPNFSLGVNLFFRIVEQASRTLGALGRRCDALEAAAPGVCPLRLARIPEEVLGILRSSYGILSEFL